ncbi:MAG: ribose ABC transporter [Proteobacteria bacterium]|nr:ribose ABC transporter [Pseudomonadota bacterium]MBI3495860.1 ribose ABC transporter [Pseudomonadota bacterium]
MLKGIDLLLNADLLYALASMGHGDEIAVVDANFPAASVARRLIRLDGVDAPRALAAILTVLPLDSFVATPVHVMQVVGDPKAVPPAVRDFRPIVERAAGRPIEPNPLERHAFYERARACYAIVATGEGRKYGNIILAKGVIATD